MEKYEKLEMEVIVFEAEDVITSSIMGNDGGQEMGGGSGS